MTLRNSAPFPHRFMRVWASKNAMRAPTAWSLHTPGSSGKQWREVDSPATSLVDLQDYLSSVLPALLYCCHFDARTSRGVIDMPDLKVGELMPLWPLLQEAMTQRRVSTALTIAIHALLLSLLCVNGDRRCARIAITTKTSFVRFLQQLDRDAGLYTNPPCHLKIDLMQWWLSNVVSCASHEWLPNRLKGAELALAKSQLDAAMLLNPYLAGQQLLVVSFGCALCGGCAVIDGVAQSRLLLHIYNAMFCVGVIDEPIALLELLIEAFDHAEVSPVWTTGARPRAAFAASFPTEGGRQAVAPEELSMAYRRAALHDARTRDGRAAAGVAELLEATKMGFRSDGLVGINLVAVGGLLLKLLEDVIASTGWRQEVDEEVKLTLKRIKKEKERAQAASGGEAPPKPGDMSASETEESVRRDAARPRFMSLLALCDTLAETKAKPDVSPVEIAALTVEGSALAQAARAIVDGVKAVRPADYRVVG